MAEEASALREPLHSDEFKVVELGRTGFRELRDQASRRGSFVSVPDFKRAIDEFLGSVEKRVGYAVT